MKTLLKISLLGLAHGLSDCAAGYMIGTLPSTTGHAWLDIGALVILYNTLAFGGQVPAGMLVDRLGRPRLVLVLSLCLVAAALVLFPMAPMLSIAMAGVAGAFFHVSGGMLALLAYPGSTVGAGLFAAPGVMGLALGGYMAWGNVPALMLLAAMVTIVGTLILILEFPRGDAALLPASAPETLAWHDVFMLVLLLAIALRSAVWNVFELIHSAEHGLLLALGLAAMLGKVAGGFLAARLGWRRYAVVALAVASPLLTLGGANPWTLLPGIFLLQSATPAAVLGMYRLMPRLPATAIGMCFGLAIAIGGIPALLGWQPPWYVIGLLLAVAAGGYAIAVRKPTSADAPQARPD